MSTQHCIVRTIVRLTAACAALLLAALPARPAAQTAANYTIGAQDVLTIQVLDDPALGGKYTVETDGTFSFPLIGRVKASGMSLRAFEGELRSKLADGYFKNPQVTVAIETYRSQRVFVNGEVRMPGPVPLTGGMTLIEALSRAGSTLPTSSGEVSVVRPPQPSGGAIDPQMTGAEVFRATIRDLESGVLKQNIELRDGDQIYVPRAELVYVFGQVKNPGSYGIQKETTVLQALSLAGGVTPNGAMGRIEIVRIVNGETQTVKKVKLTDVVLPGDTIKVPERYF
jgi:polysaccharide export outer membrane protein